jgi:kinesin family protein 13
LIFFIKIPEKYTRGVSAVESILVLDRLRQSVAVKELETTRGNQQLSMRKTCSVPNFSQVIKFFPPKISHELKI